MSEQAPPWLKQDAELAGGRDDPIAMPAPAAGALTERVRRAGLHNDAPACLDQHPAGGSALAH